MVTLFDRRYPQASARDFLLAVDRDCFRGEDAAICLGNDGNLLSANATGAQVCLDKECASSQNALRGGYAINGYVARKSLASHANGVNRNAPCAQRKQRIIVCTATIVRTVRYHYHTGKRQPAQFFTCALQCRCKVRPGARGSQCRRVGHWP